VNVPKSFLTIGEMSRRSGLPVSTLHFYERKGLISPERTAANHRVFRRDTLRRVAIIKVAQTVGLPLTRIAAALSELPRDTAPDTQDWARLAEGWNADLTARIAALTALRDKMTDCIGCGCLSVKACPLMNPADHLADEGPGPHLLSGGETAKASA
jgi:MerR family redox-sensitive transcriptional activator SoxR